MALESKFSVKRNLLEKAIAYLRGSVGIEHKISQFNKKRPSNNDESAAIRKYFGTG